MDYLSLIKLPIEAELADFIDLFNKSLMHSDGLLSQVLDHIRQHLDEPLDVDALAALACMSPRHFSRRFTEETGLTPARAVEKLRVEAAAAALESGREAVQKVARDCGFGDQERMRRAFLRILGRPPSALRPKRA